MNQILIAEDESLIASFIAKGLRANGFLPTITSDTEEILNLSISDNFDLLILDLELPSKDGLEVLEEIRGQGVNLAVIILTARNDINDKVAGLEGGADDYMTKPFRFEELLARIKLRLRNNQATQVQEETVLTVGNVLLDLKTRKAKVKGDLIDLPVREFTLAETLFRHPEQVMSREQLLDRVWGYDYDPGSNIVDVYIGYLRKKLGSELIETVRGMGYRLRK